MQDNKISVAVYLRFANHPEPKTALYCRTAVKDDFAILCQTSRLYSYAIDNGYTNPYAYIDNGESGSTLSRPAMNRLIKDIKAGLVQTVIVTGTSRIARGMEPMSKWFQILNAANVPYLSLDNDGQDMRSTFNDFNDFIELLLSSSAQV
jgi:DNA invertase Pin-like site-specific DNA recombinase